MKTPEALRQADPAKQLSRAQLEYQDEQLIQQILATEVDRIAQPAAVTRRSEDRRTVGHWRPAVATAVVAIAVITGSILVFRAVSVTGTRPAISPTSQAESDAALEAAVFSKAEEASNGEESVREQPALTWTQASRSPTGGPIDLAGKAPVLAAACEGGGTIAIRISGRSDIYLNCTRLTAIGPINLRGTDEEAVSIDVLATAGSPRYLAKTIALTQPILKTNARGQTYGPDTGIEHPDLIAASATNRRAGYVSADKLTAADPCQNPANPTAAVKCNQDHATDTITIPVYKNDGITRIGTYKISN